MSEQPPLVIVDTANVIGSVPDGWWRDRLGAAERLRDALAPVAVNGLPGHLVGPVELVLVVEGAARGLTPIEGVRVEPAPGSGDDRIVRLVEEEGRGRVCLVVTADRELRRRLTALGAVCTGPRAVHPGAKVADGPGPVAEPPAAKDTTIEDTAADRPRTGPSPDAPETVGGATPNGAQPGDTAGTDDTAADSGPA